MNHCFQSFSARGLDAQLVRVEVDHYSGHPGLVIVGLGDTAIQESRERVRASLKNCGYRFPRGRVVVNLAPADLPKIGPSFDLPIALGLIGLTETFLPECIHKSAFFGELALDGSLRSVSGVLGLVSHAQQAGFQRVYVPDANREEAALVEGIEVYGVHHLKQLVSVLQGTSCLERVTVQLLHEYFRTHTTPVVDFSDIRGQEFAKRAMEISAAGAHNFLMNGSPGSGKTLLAKALPGILPQMTIKESLEVTKIYSLAGLLPEREFLIRQRPFRIAHHTASGASLVGGGRVPMPGEISLAHRGILFLDEVAEFPQHTLDLLRQPLEDRQITITRTMGSTTYPAQFVLCAAMNPCPCGYYQVPESTRECTCTLPMISKYQSRLSGPFLDRIDLYCRVSPVPFRDLSDTSSSESSTDVLERVQRARDIQTRRFQDLPLFVNSEMSSKLIRVFCQLSNDAESILSDAMKRLHLSARAYHRVLKCSRTIADLDGSERIEVHHLLEALQYRCDLGLVSP